MANKIAKLKTADPTNPTRFYVERKQGPTPWGSSYYGLFSECKRKFYFRYVLGIVPKPVSETAPWNAEDRQEGVKLNPLRVGTLFHLYLEKWFNGDQRPNIEDKEQPPNTTGEEIAEAERLSGAYFQTFGNIFTGHQLLTQQAMLKRAGTVLTKPELKKLDQGRASHYELGFDGKIHFKILGVEEYVELSTKDDLHQFGLLLPITTRLDMRVEEFTPAGMHAVHEHKTTYQRINPEHKRMDLQIRMEQALPNLVNLTASGKKLPLGKQGPVDLVVLNQAVKGVKDPSKIIPDRIPLIRSPHQQAEVIRDIRGYQREMLRLWGRGEQSWDRNPSNCWFWNKPCVYMDICDQGKRAAHMYEEVKVDEKPDEEAK